MDRVREKLLEARQKNVDDCWYVPRLAIDEIIDSDTISQIIMKNDILGDETDSILATAPQDSHKEFIHEQAKITFAISCYVEPPCLRYMARLIKYADERGSEVDKRLPFSKRALCDCDFEDKHVEKFFSTQWLFISPKIRLGTRTIIPSEFGPEVILPFRFCQARNKPLPESGAFGTVMEMCVEEGHQAQPAYTGRVGHLTPLLAFSPIDSQFTQIVRKQFHPEIPKKCFLRELRNLCILSSARHENIIQLLGAYVQNNSFNLIFPLVSHGNLDQLFNSDSPLSWPVMASERLILMALSGLASALVTMHAFTTESIHLIGCHRDLKPANILVDGTKFLLADFGLSRIVNNQETSSSTAPIVVGDFIAPEHESKDFTRNPIGRSSDVWAFGCVTLMLLTYLQEGRQGLDILESKRRVEWPGYAHHCFHDYDRPNPGLEELFQKLGFSQSVSVQGLFHLVKKILVLEKNLRPKATAIDAHIRCLIIYNWSTSIEEAFGRACKSDYIHVHFERAKFRGWRSAVKICESDFPEFHQGSVLPRFGSFEIVIEHLRELQVLLESFSDGPINQGRKAFLPVRSRIDRLLEALDQETRTIALGHTEFMILESTKLSWLGEMQRLADKTLDERTRSKVATRRQVLRPSCNKELYIDLGTLEPKPDRTKLSVVHILSNEGPEPDIVLAEEAFSFSRYQSSQHSTYNTQLIPTRLQETANLLAISGQIGLFRVLNCRGYYYCRAKLQSGLLYELPSSPNGKLKGIVTLHEILGGETAAWCLGDRFHLARGLATAVYELHSVAWLHRNISASNIAFFYDKTRDTIDPESFYFVGFARSRADRDLTDSDGPFSGLYNEEYYQHPRYLSQDQGFQMHHEYHALGILLLEIGLWKLFHNAVGDRPVNHDSAIAMIPQLGWMTGSHYRDAVAACLDGTLSDASLAQQGQKMPLAFRAKIVDQLSSNHCRA